MAESRSASQNWGKPGLRWGTSMATEREFTHHLLAMSDDDFKKHKAELGNVFEKSTRQDIIAHFKHEGTYRADARATLVFDKTTTVEDDPMAAERSIWDEVPFDGLHPAIEHSVPSTREILTSFLRARPSI